MCDGDGKRYFLMVKSNDEEAKTDDDMEAPKMLSLIETTWFPKFVVVRHVMMMTATSLAVALTISQGDAVSCGDLKILNSTSASHSSHTSVAKRSTLCSAATLESLNFMVQISVLLANHWEEY